MRRSHTSRRELNELRDEIRRLQAREKTLRAALLSKRLQRLAGAETDPVERRLRQVFCRPPLLRRLVG